MMPNGRVRQWLLVGGLLFALAPGALHAQLQDKTGTVATGLLLRRMSGVKRILMIAAHPDDEDDALIAALARGQGIETAYLSLSRGDGGQNLLGPELWEGLGIIRTGELQAARKIDGGEQFFTRAFDFGFSKTAKETLEKWPEQDLMRDVVWRIRKFRPQVVITVFTGTPADGHGQHQAAGIVARKAFKVAGDPSVFPDQLKDGVEAWTPLKLYQLHRRGGDNSTTVVETGKLDPLLGVSYLQLGMQSRSMHRTQDMGMPQPLGPAQSGVQLIGNHTSARPGQGIFAGVDTTITGMADDLHGATERAVQAHLSAYVGALRAADEHFHAADPEAIAPDLAEAAAQLEEASRAAGRDAPLDFREDLAEKMDLATKAYMAADGVELDVRTDDDLVTPGQAVKLTVRLWNGGPVAVHGAEPSVAIPAGWTSRLTQSAGIGAGGSVAPNTIATWTYEVTLSDSAALSKLYYLLQPRDGDMYRWPANRPDLWGLPRDPAPVTATVRFDVDRSAGKAVTLAAHGPWEYVGVDKAKGQFTHPVLVVPAVSVKVSPDHMVWPQVSTEHRTIEVRVRSDAKGGTKGEVRLEAPAGWTVTPASRPYELKAEDAEETLSFDVTPSGALAAGEHVFHAVVRTSDGREFREGFDLIDYPHIERALLFHDAASHVAVVPVKVTPGLRVGYIMGSGDPGFDAIEQLGVNVKLLDPAQVRAGDFSHFDVIVTGVRAYETRPDLREANGELLNFAKNGGTVVVQYNKYEYPRGGFAPYPVSMTRPEGRTTDEHSPVTILHPDAPVFTTPNKITLADFDGWVHERGLYYLSTWDSHFVPMLAMNDPGEAPLKGSLMVTPLGKGVYVYAALAFFRQFPAGVPGAYRLFANLISLKASDWQAWLATQKNGG
jgi:LmbE family N-acetylglucosaminyl deacetylase